jgi:hypothetical protein
MKEKPICHQISPNCSSGLQNMLACAWLGRRGGASTGMDETNGSVDGGQVEMSAFDHPRSEPDDLPGWKGFLPHEDLFWRRLSPALLLVFQVAVYPEAPLNA